MKKWINRSRFSLFVVLQTIVLQGYTQEVATIKQYFKLSGFIKSNYWFDTRKVDGSRDDLFLYYPKKPVYDIQGLDINEGFNANYSAINTRLTLTITGPELLNAKVNGLIESDYTGVTNADIDGLRLRHAYILMKWKKDELLLGQTWHPMFVPDVFPEVLAFNTGAPFQPFIRNPMASYKHHFGKLSFQLAFIMQRDNNSDGPSGRSHLYMQEAGIPNSHIQLQYRFGNHVIGGAFDHKVLQPMSVTTNRYKTNELLSSLSGMAYWKYTKSKLTVQMKSIFGQNLTEHLMLGGYAVASRDSVSLIETYTPTNHLFVWTGIHYGEKYRFGLFGGFAKNYGTSDRNINIYYGKGSDIDYMYRLAPGFCYRTGPLRLAAELEYTAAAFGKADDHGRVKETSLTGVARLLFVAVYHFNN